IAHGTRGRRMGREVATIGPAGNHSTQRRWTGGGPTGDRRCKGRLAAMCLAVPGKIIELLDAKPPFASAIVEFGGICREVSVACVPEAVEGDYVMVHAGIAISRVDAEDAARVLGTLKELNLDEPDDVTGPFSNQGAKPK